MSASQQNPTWWASEAEERFERAFGLSTAPRGDSPPSYESTITLYPPCNMLSAPGSSRQLEDLEQWRWPDARHQSRVGLEDVDTEGVRSTHDFVGSHVQRVPLLAAPIGEDPFMAAPGAAYRQPVRNVHPKQSRGGRRPPIMGRLQHHTLPQRPVAPSNGTIQQLHLAPNTMPPIRTQSLAQSLLTRPATAKSLLSVKKGRRGSSKATGIPFGNFQQDRPPFNVQPPLDVEIGMCEICIFMPNWLHIVEVVVRLMRNGASRGILAKMQLLATGELTQENFIRCKNKIQQQFGECGRLYYGTNSWDINLARNDGVEDDLTANSWATHRRGSAVKFEHMKLADIYSAVPTANFPTGRDRLLFTQCLEFARSNPQLDLDTSHFDWIIQSQGLQAPLVPVGRNRDEEAIIGFDEPDP